MTDTEWNEFQKRRSESPFRMRFHLTDDEKQIVYEKGMENMRIKAEEIIRKRLSAAFPINDGKQTPMKGYPVFKAQHATECC